MGYSYSRQGICCDNCGISGQRANVRRRPCTFKITTDNLRTPGGHRHVLRYCPAPALCSACLNKLGGTKAVHARCAEGAAHTQAQYDATQAKLDAGEKLVISANGMPDDRVVASFAGAGHSGIEQLIIPADLYSKHFTDLTLREYQELIAA